MTSSRQIHAGNTEVHPVVNGRRNHGTAEAVFGMEEGDSMVRWARTGVARTVRNGVCVAVLGVVAALSALAVSTPAAWAGGGEVSGSVTVEAQSGLSLYQRGVRFGAGLLLWPLPVDLKAINGQLATSGQPYTPLVGRNWALGVHGEMFVGPWQLGLVSAGSVLSAGSGEQASALMVQFKGMQALYDLGNVAGAIADVTGARQLKVAGGITLGYGSAGLTTGTNPTTEGKTHFRMVVPQVVASLPLGSWSDLQLSLGYVKPAWMRSEGAAALQPAVESLQGWTMGGGVGIRF